MIKVRKLAEAKKKDRRIFDDFIRSFHSETLKTETTSRTNRRKKFINFFFKISVVFFASLLTTLAFSFLMSPNGIYNSGLNGILQSFFIWLSGNKDNVREYQKYFIFATALVINILIILFLGVFFNADWEMMSTAFFYSGFQLFWTWFFEKWHLSDYLFSNLMPENWNYWISQRQLGFTLPFYISIAIGAAIIHTYGYSLIFQARATPGGLEIITSHLSTKKKSKTSISFLFKLFGFLIIFLITAANFLWIDDNIKVKKADLKTYLLRASEKIPTEKNLLRANDDLEEVLDTWKKNWQKKKDLEEINLELLAKNDDEGKEVKEKNQEMIIANQQEIYQIEVKNSDFFTFLKRKIGSKYLDDYPAKEIDIYLTEKKDLINSLRSEIEDEEKEILLRRGKEEKKKKYLKYLKEKLEIIEKDYCERNLFGYLKYITNNERFWATIVYVFFSSLLISQMFPKDVKVILNVQTDSRNKLNKVISLLRQFDPFYYATSSYEEKRPGEEKTLFVVNCSLSKWNYYLLQNELKSLKVMFFINERS